MSFNFFYAKCIFIFINEKIVDRYIDFMYEIKEKCVIIFILMNILWYAFCTSRISVHLNGI